MCIYIYTFIYLFTYLFIYYLFIYSFLKYIYIYLFICLFIYLSIYLILFIYLFIYLCFFLSFFHILLIDLIFKNTYIYIYIRIYEYTYVRCTCILKHDSVPISSWFQTHTRWDPSENIAKLIHLVNQDLWGILYFMDLQTSIQMWGLSRTTSSRKNLSAALQSPNLFWNPTVVR